METRSETHYLKLAFLIGGIYDLLLGIPMVLVPRFLSDLLDIEYPSQDIFMYLTGTFLIAVGYYLVYASRDPENYLFIGFGSALIRLIFALIVIIKLIGDDIEVIFGLFAFTDILTALFLLLTIMSVENYRAKLF
ncbi:MAG: hypothetical protein ACXAD7_21410 [Candidatus Kariarchaeaceae archaeon]|jgi:hypothetical protein